MSLDLGDVKSELREIEAEADAAAVQQVAAMLQRPDQLEKLDVFRARAVRKRAAVDAMLKSAVQSQLEGVRSGIQQLAQATQDVHAIGENLDEIATILDRLAPMKEKLGPLRAESMKHRQQKAAIENLSQTYNVPETVEKTFKLLEDSELLAAHANLMELERARDAVMFEVYSMTANNPEQQKQLTRQLNMYFDKVDKVAAELGKRVFHIMSRCLEYVRSNDPGPQQVVTALRIIEREERIDEYCRDQYEKTKKADRPGFMAPGRPRKWREKCFQHLETVVREKIEAIQLEDRSTNKQWLVRYLEACRIIVLEDLRVAQQAAQPCFPVEPYYIYDRYVRMYHEAIANRIDEIAVGDGHDGLEKNEVWQLLQWINQYPTEKMMGLSALDIDVEKLLEETPLLAPDKLRALYERFLLQTRADVRVWMAKSLEREKDDWYSNSTTIERDSQGLAYTTFPSNMFQIVEDQVGLAKGIKYQLIPDIVKVCMEEMLPVAERYKDSLVAFKNKHFEDRSRWPQFTMLMVVAANNADTCAELTERSARHITLTMEARSERSDERKRMLQLVEKLDSAWLNARMGALQSLYEELCRDIGSHLADIHTRRWIQHQSSAMASVCETVKDYGRDYVSLKPPIFQALIQNIQMRILAERASCNSPAERVTVAKQWRQEAQLIERSIELVMSHKTSDVSASRSDEKYMMAYEPLTDFLLDMADIVQDEDKSLLQLVISSYVRKYPDITVEQLQGCVLMRGDVGKADARSMAEDALHHNRIRPPGETRHTRLFRKQFLPDPNMDAGLSVLSRLKDVAKEKQLAQ